MESYWGDHLTRETRERAGFEEPRAFAKYEKKRGNELYEIYVGSTYSASGKEVEFLVVDMMSTKESPRHLWLGIFADQNLSYPQNNKDRRKLRKIAKKVVKKGMKISYGDLELTFRRNLGVLANI